MKHVSFLVVSIITATLLFSSSLWANLSSDRQFKTCFDSYMNNVIKLKCDNDNCLTKAFNQNQSCLNNKFCSSNEKKQCQIYAASFVGPLISKWLKFCQHHPGPECGKYPTTKKVIDVYCKLYCLKTNY